jgi:hypothetical protein
MTHFAKKLIPVAVAAVAAAAIFVAPATAAGRHKDPPISVDPAAPTVMSNLTFSGCGYTPNSNVSVVVNSPFAISWGGAPTDGSGCWSTSSWTYTALMAGSYTVQAWLPTDRSHPSGSLTFNVS